MKKWICNKCGFVTNEQPQNKNTICQNCRKGRFKLIVTCKCGKEFHPERATQKYCSKECGNKYRLTGGKLGKHYPSTQRARIAICEVCGKEFRAVNDYKDKKAKYCSKECWSVRATIIKKCLYCGAEISTCKSADKKYCNNICRDLHYRQTLKGEKSHFWQGGKTEQSKLIKTSAEYKEWRRKVFERDNYTCQKCGKKSTPDLEAHHIKAQSLFPELIFDVDNGLTLCHDCHRKTDNYGWKAQKQKAVLLNAVDADSAVEEVKEV